ncbi:uncharacterized protein LOC135955416 [Calliphora vicina]|uniref:uncharacterized protein LOC135955416 n=1 Tax=Calliphora vicina TaxID=7373 RepID=UPI00325B2D3B
MKLTTQHLTIIYLIVVTNSCKIITAASVNTTDLVSYTGNTNITDLVNFINKEKKIEVNVLVNFDENYDTSDYFLEVVKAIETPKLIVSKQTYRKNSKPLFERFNSNSLTIAWLTTNQLNVTLEILDHILWRIHFKDILLVHQLEPGEKSYLNNTQLLEIFQKCWTKGFISVLLWSRHRLYTYHPYPSIKVVHVKNADEFLDKTHLNNFQLYSWRMPFFDFPNLCYSYTNRKGQLVRTGYFYKWVQLYLEYYNATIDHYFIDMWAQNYTQLEAIETLNEMGYSLLPIFLSRNAKYYEKSDVLHLTKVLLMVPKANEISASLYLALPYNGFIWFIIIVSCVLFFIIIYLIQRTNNRNIVKDLSRMALQAFSIIIFLSIDLGGKKSLKHYYLHLLFLFTGIFLTNYYTSNLSSLYAAKVYEPEIRYLSDIGRTNLKILEHSVDVEFMLNLNLPKQFNGRFITGSNTELPKYRLALNISYMYTTHEEFVDFLLFQQQYLKHPIARKMEQEMYYRAHYVTVPHRSPLIDHFNRYLSRIRDNGMLEKFVRDTKWDGVMSGYLKLMRDPEERKALTLEYFRYAFVLWIFGLFSAMVAFLFELRICAFKRKRDN